MADSNAVQRRDSLQVVPRSAQAFLHRVNCGFVSCVSACITGNGLKIRWVIESGLEELEVGIELLKRSLAGILDLAVVFFVKDNEVVSSPTKHQTFAGHEPGMV